VGCKPHLTSRFCRVELGLKRTSNIYQVIPEASIARDKGAS